MEPSRELFDNSRSHPNDDLDLLTYEDLESLLKIPKRTLRRWKAREDIPYIEIGRKVRFSRSRIFDWLREKGDI